MNSELEARLTVFQKTERVNSKGSLSVALYLSRAAKEQGLPLSPESLVTDKEGQVKGLGASVIRKILKEYGITRTLAEEAGRVDHPGARGASGGRRRGRWRWRWRRCPGRVGGHPLGGRVVRFGHRPLSLAHGRRCPFPSAAPPRS